ncbi:PAS domain-containing protein [Candidatus Poribacteria bacterium]|nr:PAS domain-containing protein [Candidatus Poribacteria bacterium]
MAWDIMLETRPLGLTGIAMAVLAVYVFWRRPTPEGRALALLMAGVAIWSNLYMLELTAIELPAKLFWAKLKYIGIVIVPPAWLLFAIQYAGYRRWNTPFRFALLVAGAAGALATVLTNDAHHLFWKSAEIDLSGRFSVLHLPMGIAFWFWATYFYLLLLSGTILIIVAFFRSSHFYRKQAGAILIAALAPLAGNILFLSGLSPVPHLDLTPFALAISCLACTWALFHLYLADLVPIARAAIVDSMDDCVIVLDKQSRVAEMNPPAQRLAKRPLSSVIGQPVDKTLPELSARLNSHAGKTADEEMVLYENGRQHTYDVKVSRLLDHNDSLISEVVVLRDITQRKQMEVELMKHKERLEDLVRERTTELVEINEQLVRQIVERRQTEEKLEASRSEIRLLSKKLMQTHEEERRGLSLNLHEGLAQYVASVKMAVENLSKLANVEDQRTRDTANDIGKKLDAMTADIRHLSTRLRPRMLDEIGLASTIESYLMDFEDETGIRCEWECEVEDKKYNPEVTTCLYRVMQEALSNISRHSGASCVKVGLCLKEKCLALVVEDNGHGFDPSRIDVRRSLGLVGIRERVDQLSGTVTTFTQVGQGTRIEARVPIE